MGNHHRRIAKLPWLVAALLVCLPSAPAAPGQEPTGQPESRRSDSPRRPRRHADERGRPRGERGRPENDQRGRPPDGEHGPRWQRRIFEPAPEDRGPLKPGEAEELREFVAKEMPRLARLLERIEERDPNALQRGSARLIARLRQLRRIHAEDPELAQLVARHAGNLVGVEMLRRASRRVDEDQRELLRNKMRAYVAENVEIEAQVLERWADNLEAGRDALVQRRVAELIEPDADLSAEPARVREAVEKLLAETDSTRQESLRTTLADLLTKQMDNRIAAMRDHVQRLRDKATEEVDRRLEHLTRERGPRRGRPPRP